MIPLTSPRLLLPRLDVENNIGYDGAKALADFLKPHELHTNLNDSWCHNKALMELDLVGESSPLPFYLYRQPWVSLFVILSTRMSRATDTGAVDLLNSIGFPH